MLIYTNLRKQTSLGWGAKVKENDEPLFHAICGSVMTVWHDQHVVNRTASWKMGVRSGTGDGKRRRQAKLQR